VLYLISTPIGNLGDISFRAIEVLRSCDYILCEDTRRSLQLLNHYQIKKPLKSYHKFNEKRRSQEIIRDLKEGLAICLISDAGTPGISDPGEILIQHCHEEGVEMSVIPGACAAIAALTLSGFTTERFQFIGFLPKKKGALSRMLSEFLTYDGTSICYESPFRLLKTLQLLATLNQTAQVAVVREITKIHEECIRGTTEELFAHFTKKAPRGEIVLLISGLG
jgi:16S rRNA (cytidine1402-2'-O)-methyltransferase